MDQQALHQSVEATLKQHDCDIGAAECHGVLCGMLCSANPFSATEWLTHTMGYQHDTDLSTLGAREPLQQLYQQTHNELVSQDFSFSILIPSDDYSTAARTEALGAWCRGFLSGFGISERDDYSKLSSDSQDYLKDLEKIGRVTVEDADDEEEFALFEVYEYARMGALLLREDTQGSGSAEQTPVIH